MKKYILGFSLMALSMVSCSDFFETESTHYLDAGEDHIHNASDTIYSVIGILNKVQAIGDRMVLLGELRGDLVNVTDVADADLREIAMFQGVDEDNVYNQPVDYYAIINNCNYYIAHCDTAMKNNRNEQLFVREYAAVKAIRAWTYLQLVTTYGKVPFVTEPILDSEEALLPYPMYDIKQICDYFIQEDGLQALRDYTSPSYGEIKQLPSQAFFFPIDLVLGDLNLWAGYYWEAALCYHRFLTVYNGRTYLRNTGTDRVYWYQEDNKPMDWDPTQYIMDSWSGNFGLASEKAAPFNSELITIIPGDSVRSEGHYSVLRDVFNATKDNEYKASVVPSQSLIDLSAAQVYCHYNKRKVSYAPATLPDYSAGDLRLKEAWDPKAFTVYTSTSSYDGQYVWKYSTRNVHVYRIGQVYLRLAEAVNRAGYPRYAYQILSTGVSSYILQNAICPEYPEDSLKLVTNLSFPKSFHTFVEDLTRYNTLGIHSRGSGYTDVNVYYTMPYNDEISDRDAQIAWQQDAVEDMIVDELALECAFEGTRFYDLMRIALHRGQPAYLADKVYARQSAGTGISADLTNPSNWFLNWKNQIGY